MLSTIGSIASQGGRPPNVVSLSHFNSSLLDNLSRQWVWSGSSSSTLTYPTRTDFGNYLRLYSPISQSSELLLENVYAMSAIAQQDFTFEFWLSSNTDFNMHIGVFNGNRSITLGILNGTLTLLFYNSSNVAVNNLTCASSGLAFYRFGRKGNTFFLIKNGVKVTQIISSTISLVPDSIRLSVGTTASDSSVYLDEFMIQVGTGNDSTDIPTKAYDF